MEKGSDRVNNNPTTTLQLINNPSLIRSHLDILHNNLLDYEFKQKHISVKYCVYNDIAELLGWTPGSVRKIFNPNDTTGIKLGTVELMLICAKIGNDESIRCMLSDFESLMGGVKSTSKDENMASAGLDACMAAGELAGEIKLAVEDSKITANESKVILSRVSKLEEVLASIKNILN